MTKIVDFKKYTSIHIGPICEVKVIDTIDCYDEYQIIGRGNNLLISNNPPKFALLGDQFNYIKIENQKLKVGAATPSGKLLSFCKKNNIAHFEFLAKLPGNIGGLIKMNAGLKEWEIFNHLHSITTQNGVFLKNDIAHSYRKTDIKGIIFEAVFHIEYGYDPKLQKMFQKMRQNQPSTPSAGSCFKNPVNASAGYLIEQVGLKGYSIGDMAFSSQHANFLVNLGDGSYDDAIKLIQLAKTKVKKQFDIELEEEIIIF